MSSDRREPIPLCAPEIAGAEWDYVKECLDTSWVSSAGPFVSRFEREFAAKVGSPHAVAVGNGTAALHLALQVAGVGQDDEVPMPSLTFIAPANTVRYLGAWPVFFGVDEATWQLDPALLERFLAEDCEQHGETLINRRTGRRIAAILPVHILGHPSDIGAIMAIADRFGLPVVEDATEALGSLYRGRMPGTFGLLGCYSFNGNKLMTTGGGGMIVTEYATLAKRAKYLSEQAKDGTEFVHGEIGYNYRLSNLHAAVGVAQLERLDIFRAAKHRIAMRYASALGTIPGITVMPEADWATSAWWMYTILVDPDRFGMDAAALGAALAAVGIQNRMLWQPLHLSKPHFMCEAIACKSAERVAERGLSIPCSVGLTTAQQDRVIDAISALAAGGQRRVAGARTA
jgi:perosamine synthetase